MKRNLQIYKVRCAMRDVQHAMPAGRYCRCSDLSFIKLASILLLAVSLLTILTGCSRDNGSADANAGPREVKLAPVTSMTFLETTHAQGTIEAERFAMVPARTGGILQEILVEDGAAVTNGQILARLDADQLQNARVTRQQEVRLAESALSVAEAQAEQAKVERERAAREQHRFATLLQDQAVSQQQAEQIETQWKAALAADSVAVANVELAKARIRQARAAAAIAERDVQDTIIRAPLDGAISQRMHQLGESIPPNNPVFRIDATQQLRFSAFLPARRFPDISPGETPLQLQVANRSIAEQIIHYRSPTVHAQLRTFEIRSRLDTPPAWVVPGMMATATIVIDQRDGRGVPTDAVIRNGGETYVMIVADDIAKRVNIQTGYRTDNMLEILEGLPDTITHIIRSGHHGLESGTPVVIQNEE